MLSILCSDLHLSQYGLNLCRNSALTSSLISSLSSFSVFSSILPIVPYFIKPLMFPPILSLILSLILALPNKIPYLITELVIIFLRICASLSTTYRIVSFAFLASVIASSDSYFNTSLLVLISLYLASNTSASLLSASFLASFFFPIYASGFSTAPISHSFSCSIMSFLYSRFLSVSVIDSAKPPRRIRDITSRL